MIQTQTCESGDPAHVAISLRLECKLITCMPFKGSYKGEKLYTRLLFLLDMPLRRAA